jgi:2-polyprenyl-6-methoxyphenol hydroxylase-like FAD-dependent oxidoreductase
LTNEEYLERNAQRFAEILPGNPKPEDYKIANISPYKLHQRCVPSMRVGRVLLAADAAHLCNPFGGLGLTGGIADISSLFDCLLAIHEGHTGDSILDKWSEVRIRKWREIIDPMSRANFRRLWDNEVLEEREMFFDMCRAITQGGEGRQAYRAVSIFLLPRERGY